MAASFAIQQWTDLPCEAGLAALIWLGVIAPMLVPELWASPELDN